MGDGYGSNRSSFREGPKWFLNNVDAHKLRILVSPEPGPALGLSGDGVILSSSHCTCVGKVVSYRLLSDCIVQLPPVQDSSYIARIASFGE